MQNHRDLKKVDAKFQLALFTDHAYRSGSRAVYVHADCNNAWVETVGYLYRSAVVKTTRTGLYISWAGHYTRTTSRALAACLPFGWSIRRYRVYTPRNVELAINGGGPWTEVKDPGAKYLAQYCTAYTGGVCLRTP